DVAAILCLGLAAVARSGDGHFGAAAARHGIVVDSRQALSSGELSAFDRRRCRAPSRAARALVGMATDSVPADLQPAAALGVRQFPVWPRLCLLGAGRLDRMARA